LVTLPKNQTQTYQLLLHSSTQGQQKKTVVKGGGD
jgi:hypothetical protein